MQTSRAGEIRVAGVLDASWSAWFEGLVVTSDSQLGQTVIAGPVADQAALHGVLTKVRDMGRRCLRCSALGRTDATSRLSGPSPGDQWPGPTMPGSQLS